MPIFKDILSSILNKGNVLETVKDTVDEFVYTKEERAEDDFEQERWREEQEYRNQTLDAEILKQVTDSFLALEETYASDRADSRKREQNIAELASDKLWGVTVNVNFIIALLVIVADIILHILDGMEVFTREIELHTFDTIMAMVITYYFGTSVGSKTKEEMLKKIMNSNSNP